MVQCRIYNNSDSGPSLSMSTLLTIATLIFQSSLNPVTAFTFPPRLSSPLSQAVQIRSNLLLRSTNTNGKDSNENQPETLLEKASRLRKEAQDLQDSLADSSSTNSTAIQQQQQKEVQKKRTIYTSLDDSIWDISYRFASDTPPSENEEKKEKEKDDSTTNEKKIQYYSGKVSVQLLGDGYTNQFVDSSNDSKSSSSTLTFVKFWGWDLEYSQGKEDPKQEFLSFSADVKLPTSDPYYQHQLQSNKQYDGISRFYFNARVNRSRNTENGGGGEITLTDGTVTLKRDVESPTGQGGGFWGIFNAGGILAQFRYCGEFLMKSHSS